MENAVSKHEEAKGKLKQSTRICEKVGARRGEVRKSWDNVSQGIGRAEAGRAWRGGIGKLQQGVGRYGEICRKAWEGVRKIKGSALGALEKVSAVGGKVMKQNKKNEGKTLGNIRKLTAKRGEFVGKMEVTTEIGWENGPIRC